MTDTLLSSITVYAAGSLNVSDVATWLPVRVFIQVLLLRPTQRTVPFRP
jgi:hypothetical protein